MQVSVAGLRRNIKNIAHNYTEPQKKVREATSNDPWGPSSTLMSEIADLTYNIEAFAQIMEMLWKRLNDHGKNWRHVYKSLVLLEYLIKTGSERVAQQCKENIFAIQTLKDFQYFEESKDQGMNVREKAKQLVTLLTSEERLRNERARALKARERFAQTVSGFGSSDSNDTTPTSPTFGSAFGDEHHHHSTMRHSSSSSAPVNPDLEVARPQTVGEEELQLQLALAMSKEEADQEEKRRRSDELRLQMALSQSEQEFQTTPTTTHSNALVDLLDVDLGGAAGGAVGGAVGGGDPWGGGAVGGAAAAAPPDPWGVPKQVASPLQQQSNNIDPWSLNHVVDGGHQNAINAAAKDPWATSSSSHNTEVLSDPWATNGASSSSSPPLPTLDDEFEVLSKRDGGYNYNMDPLAPMTMGQPMRSGSSAGKKDPLHFLGENSNLVNLDNLVPLKPMSAMNLSPMSDVNPFAAVGASSAVSSSSGTSLLTSPAPTVNPFHSAAAAVSKPTINQMRERQVEAAVLSTNNHQHGGFHSSPSPLNPSPVLQLNPTIINATTTTTLAANNPWSPVKTENPFMK